MSRAQPSAVDELIADFSVRYFEDGVFRARFERAMFPGRRVPMLFGLATRVHGWVNVKKGRRVALTDDELIAAAVLARRARQGAR